jgi:hypothetical protein
MKMNDLYKSVISLRKTNGYKEKLLLDNNTDEKAGTCPGIKKKSTK